MTAHPGEPRLPAEARSKHERAKAGGFSRATELLARRRVALGFAAGVAALVFAQPTTRSVAIGMSIAAAGELLRVWAAGHLNKSREVTSSGPYRWVAHPLYLGSSIMGVGLAVACASVLVAALIAVYLTVTLTAAMRSEEAFLRRTFPDGYDRYRRGEASGDRRFGLGQAIANREYRAVIGLVVVALLLVWKATYNGSFWRPGF
jgi:isoprenylcysteine carboxyl methyltransferase (ICMT) family protein YpbQ